MSRFSTVLVTLTVALTPYLSHSRKPTLVTKKSHKLLWSQLNTRSPDIFTLLQSDPINDTEPESFGEEQRKYPKLSETITSYKMKRKIALQSSLFTSEDNTLYYVDSKQKHLKRLAHPTHLKDRSCQRHMLVGLVATSPGEGSMLL